VQWTVETYHVNTGPKSARFHNQQEYEDDSPLLQTPNQQN